MNKKIIFENCTIDQLEIKTSTPVTIESIKNNIIENINIITDGENLEDSLIEVGGNFDESTIQLHNSCTFIASDSFSINKPVTINSQDFCKVSVLGNYKNTKGILILSSSDLITNQDNPPRELDITVSIKDANSKLNILGNFQESNLTVSSPLTLCLDARLNEMTINDTCIQTNLNVLSNGYINNVKNYSLINLSGDSSAVKDIVSNTTVGSENIIVGSLSYILKFIDGKSDIKTSFSAPGSYAITLKLLQGDNLIELLPTVYVTVI